MERRFIEDFIVCPYDNSHVITPLRMPYHLLKCRKNFPTMEMSVCPFNAIHEVKKPELRYHMMHCPDKAILERTFQFDLMLSSRNTHLKGYTGIPRQVKHTAEPDEEYWDADVSYHTDSSLPMEEPVVTRRPRRRELETLRQPMSLPSAACITITGQGNKSPQESASAQRERKGRGIPNLYQYGPASVPVVGRGRGLTFHL